MQYEPISEKVPVAPMKTTRPATVEDYKQNRDIRRTRTTVLVLLGIQVVFALFYLGQKLVYLIQYYRIPEEERINSLANGYIGNVIAASISLIYLIIFIVVVAQYLRIGILIFAWLGIIELVCVGVVLILSIIAIIVASAALHAAGAGLVMTIFVVVVAALACLLTILTVVLAFQLAKYLKAQQDYQYV